MAHYRKIDTRILLDQKFNQLSSDERLVFLHLLIHPNLTSLGAMHASLAGIACELNWTVERLRDALDVIHQQRMVCYDESARLIWLPNFLKYNAPESPNVIKSWETALSYLPECDLQKQIIQHVRQFVDGLPTAFQDALPVCFNVAFEPNHPIASPASHPLPEGFLENAENSCPPSESFFENSNTLSEGFLEKNKNSDTPFESFFENSNSLSKPLSIKHKALNNKHKALNIKSEEINQKNNSEKKNNSGEINTIVAPTRQKKSKPPDGEVVDVFRYWQHTLGHPQAQLDTNRRKCIGKALASGYSVAQLCEAIRGCSLTPHNLGDNEQGQRYDGLHVILRNADQIDRFIRNAHSPPRRLTQADRLWADNEAAGERWMALYTNDNEEKVIHATD